MRTKLFTVIMVAIAAITTEPESAEFRFVKAYQWNSMRAAVANGNLLYCGMDEGLQIMDITDIEHPIIVGQCANDANILQSDRFARCLSQMALYKDYIFIARYRLGLEIYDVSKPDKPQMVSVIPEDVYRLAVDGNYVYISKRRPWTEQSRGIEGDLAVVSIEDIGNPKIIAAVPVDDFINDISVDGGYVFVTANRGWYGAEYVYRYPGKLIIFDVKNPSIPVEVGRYESGDPIGPVAVKGKYAFTLSGKTRLEVFDISKPSNPKSVARKDCSAGGLYAKIVLDNKYAYISPCCGRSSVFDITDPKKPVLINDDSTGVQWSRFSISDDLLFASTNDYSFIPYSLRYKSPYDRPITVFDIKDPGNIRMIAEIGELSQFEDVAVVGDYAFLADTKSGLKILDTNARPGEEIVSEFPFNLAEKGSLLAYGNRIYMDNRGSLKILDVSDVSNPRMLKEYDAGHQVPSLYVYGSFLIRGSDNWDNSDLRVIDVHDASAPQLIKQINTGVIKVADIAMENRYMYMASHGTGIQVFDIKDIGNPVFISSYDTESAEDVEVREGFAYVADYETGLMIFNVSHPDSIRFISSIIPDKYRNTFYGNESLELVLKDNYAFLFSPYQNMIFCIDISDPRHPAFVCSYGNFKDAAHIRVTDDYIYIPSNNGLLIIEFEE